MHRRCVASIRGGAGRLRDEFREPRGKPGSSGLFALQLFMGIELMEILFCEEGLLQEVGQGLVGEGVNAGGNEVVGDLADIEEGDGFMIAGMVGVLSSYTDVIGTDAVADFLYGQGKGEIDTVAECYDAMGLVGPLCFGKGVVVELSF